MKTSAAQNINIGASRLITLVSKREMEVLDLITLGYNNREIGKMLFISDHTVVSHRKNLYKKFDAYNGASLTRKAYEKGVMKA